MNRSLAAAIVALVSLVPLTPASMAQGPSPADFYKGRTVTLQVGSAAGGGYDIVGRLFARHIGKYIPSKPNIIVQNVPGGGSLQLANQFAAVAPRDGSMFAIVNNAVPATPLFTPSAAKFDARKFSYLGSPSREAHVFIAWHTSPIHTIDDLFSKEAIIGATAPGGAVYDFPFLTNAVIGTKFKIITGYPSTSETRLAMERGEIHGNAGLGWVSVKADYGDDIASGKIRVVAAFGMRPNKELTHIPLLPVGKTEEDRQLFELMYSRQDFGRPFMTPPDVPADRLAALRKAFEDTMKDKDFLTDADKLKVEVEPVSWQELHALMDRLYRTPDHVVQRMQQMLASTQKK